MAQKKIIGYLDSPNPVGYLPVEPNPVIHSSKKNPSNKAIPQSTANLQKRSPTEATAETVQAGDSSFDEKLSNENSKISLDETPQKEKDDRKKLDELVSKQPRILYHLKTIFPFDLFPDEITIEENKVNIAFREFFFAEQIRSANIEDISHVEVEKGPFFASLKIAAKSFVENFIKVEHLWAKDAIRARRIIEGLKTINGEHIDTSPMSTKEILTKAEEIGRAKGLE